MYTVDSAGDTDKNIGAACVCLRFLTPSLYSRCPARIPVRGVINTPVLRLRPFAALVPLRDYPSGSVPSKEPCRAAAVQGRRQEPWADTSGSDVFICIPGEEPFGKKMN
ncbi:hypothetical protein BEI60_15105 [Eisenbergiella tayi]|nr:hypothetical protein BEI60_15105 [Eisenbergiella tayi]